VTALSRHRCLCCRSAHPVLLTNAVWDPRKRRLIEHPSCGCSVVRMRAHADIPTAPSKASRDAVPESHLRARLENSHEARSHWPGRTATSVNTFAWCGSEQLLLKILQRRSGRTCSNSQPQNGRCNGSRTCKRPFVGAESRLERFGNSKRLRSRHRHGAAHRRLRASKAPFKLRLTRYLERTPPDVYGRAKLTERFANALTRRWIGGIANSKKLRGSPVKLAEEQAKPGTTKEESLAILDTHAALKEHRKARLRILNLLFASARTAGELIRAVSDRTIDPSVRENCLLNASRGVSWSRAACRMSNERMAAGITASARDCAAGETSAFGTYPSDQTLALASRATPPPEDGFFELAGPPRVH
jgi:hypothetical protein